MAARGRANMCSLHMCIVPPLLCESSSQPPSSSLDTIPTIIIIIIRRMCPAPYTDLSLLLFLCVVCDGARYTAGSARYISFTLHKPFIFFGSQPASDIFATKRVGFLHFAKNCLNFWNNCNISDSFWLTLTLVVAVQPQFIPPWTGLGDPQRNETYNCESSKWTVSQPCQGHRCELRGEWGGCSGWKIVWKPRNRPNPFWGDRAAPAMDEFHNLVNIVQPVHVLNCGGGLFGMWVVQEVFISGSKSCVCFTSF